ncbi:hypothetical protein NEMBOFW57_008832 [Staphylotrichum longicolle]|uniref:Uncharacterized protein n=1 Tax=Staphylotrichum longicolle TaxID=669026 RepID=A0AAD4ESE2_9PEZI|nr:hypothetical protein NEMBOFW57_008832 [Staphylotrichum longicolle]
MEVPKRPKIGADSVRGMLDYIWDDFTRKLAHRQYKDLENVVLEAVRTQVAKGESELAETFASLAAEDERRAQKVSSRFLDRRELAEKLGRAIVSELRKNCGATTPSSTLEPAKATVPGAEPVVIDLDKDENGNGNGNGNESTARPDAGESSSTKRPSHAQSPSKKCHKGPEGREYGEEEMIRDHGRRVLDDDGKDIDDGQAQDFNERLAWKLEQTRAKTKGKQKATAPSPVAPGSLPRIVMAPASRPPPSDLDPSETAQPAQSSTAPLVDGQRAPVPDMNFGFTENYMAPRQDTYGANQGRADADSVTLKVNQAVASNIVELSAFFQAQAASGPPPC